MQHRRVILIVIIIVVCALLIAAALCYIPRTRSLEYNMHGFIISRDGEIQEQFSFTVTGTEYDFIIDPPGSSVSFSGDQLTELQRDATILCFNWGLDLIASKYTSGHFLDNFKPEDQQYILGTLTYYSGSANQHYFESVMFDLDKGSVCMYADDLIGDAFIVGVTDPDADPFVVLESYTDVVNIPSPQSSSNN